MLCEHRKLLPVRQYLDGDTDSEYVGRAPTTAIARRRRDKWEETAVKEAIAEIEEEAKLEHVSATAAGRYAERLRARAVWELLQRQTRRNHPPGRLPRWQGCLQREALAR